MSISDAQFAEWLLRDNRRAILASATVYSGAGTLTRYFGSTDYVSRPSDTPAKIPYEDIIIRVPAFTARMSEVFEGRSLPSWGDLEVLNEAGTRDAWLDDGWDGRAIALQIGDPAWPLADFRPLHSGTIEDISAIDRSTLVLKLRDKQSLLNREIQSTLLPDGRLTPLAYGAIFNAEPLLVDGGTHTYQVHDGAIQDVPEVRDDGASLTTGTLTVSAVDPATDLITFSAPHGLLADSRVVFSGTVPTGITAGVTYWVIAAGLTAQDIKVSAAQGGAAVDITSATTGATAIGKNWNVDAANGKFSLVASPIGRVTCDVQGAKPGGVYLTKCADIIKEIVKTKAGLTDADLDAANFSAFATTCPQTLGRYVRDRENLLDVLDDLVASVGGFYAFTRAGLMYLGRLEAPSGTPVVSLTADDVVEDGVQLSRRILPAATLRLGYRRNHTPQPDGLADTVAEAKRAEYADVYTQIVTATNSPASIEKWAGARKPAMIETHLADSGEAATEVARRAALYGVARHIYEVRCFAAPLTLKLGDVVRLTHPRFGFAAGKLAAVVGIRDEPTQHRATLELFS